MVWRWPLVALDASAAADADQRLEQILELCRVIRFEQALLQQEFRTMSDTLAAELAAERTALDNLKGAVEANAGRVSDLAGKVSDLTAQLAAAVLVAGGPTPDQLAEMAADAAEIQAAADALKAPPAAGA